MRYFRRLSVITVLAFSFAVDAAPTYTNGFREVTQLYVNGDSKKFYLDQNCPKANNFYDLREGEVDVDVFYSTVMAAFMAGKKIQVGWNDRGDDNCVVQRIDVAK